MKNMLLNKFDLLCVYMQAEKSIADDEEEKVGFIAEEVSKKQKGWIAVLT